MQGKYSINFPNVIQNKDACKAVILPLVCVLHKVQLHAKWLNLHRAQNFCCMYDELHGREAKVISLMTGWKSWDLQSIHFLSLAKHTRSLSAYLWHCSIWQRLLHHAVLKQKAHVKTQVGIFERSPEEESFCFVTQPCSENVSVKRVQRTYNTLCSPSALTFILKYT